MNLTSIYKARYLQLKPEVFFISAYFLAVVCFLYDYFISDIYLFAGIIAIPFVCIKVWKNNFSYRYLPFALSFLVLAFFSDVLTLYYLSIVFSFLFLVESRIGKVNYLLLFLLIVLSPVFKYFVNILGFPIRLELTEICGKLFSWLGRNAEVLGNILVLDGNEFSVDPECVGLKMTVISFIIGIMFIAYFSRKEKKELNFISSSVMMAVILLLIIFCNLTRILLLVLFRISPENLFHDIAGMLCLVFYVVIPFYFISKFTFSKGILSESKTIKYGIVQSPVKKNAFTLPINFLLLVSVIITGFKLQQNKTDTAANPPACDVEGYKKEILANGVVKFGKSNSLVYVKPIQGFYSSEHSPMICWIGSGYKFKSIRKMNISGKEVYAGILVKDKEKIYASWWFDNGGHKTISQLDWRWRMIKGEKQFSIINVNSSDEDEMKCETQNLLKKNIFL